jgi:hypothetical protein
MDGSAHAQKITVMVWYLIAGARSMEWETGSRCISDVVPTLLELLQKFDSILHMAKMSAISGVSDPGLSSYNVFRWL